MSDDLPTFSCPSIIIQKKIFKKEKKKKKKREEKQMAIFKLFVGIINLSK